MESRRRARCGGQWGAGRVLLVLAMLPALLLGPALGGVAAWIHAHGPSGEHVHLLHSEHDHDVAALHEWHHAQHRDVGESGAPDDDVPAPKGLLIELPEFAVASPQSSAPITGTSLQALHLMPLPRRCPVPVEISFPQPRIRSGWPPQGAWRSGVAALLRSSHAILI